MASAQIGLEDGKDLQQILPKRDRIKAILRAFIQELQPGDALPSYSALRQRFGVSQHTIDRVIGDLRAEGLLEHLMIRQKTRSAALHSFTLVELLIVISILSILVSILQPALKKAMVSALDRMCLNNQKQANLANQTWAEDHDGNFVWGEPSSMKQATKDGGANGHSGTWARSAWVWLGYGNYVSSPQIFVCPRGVAPVPFQRSYPGYAQNAKPLAWRGGDFVKGCKEYIDNNDSTRLDKAFGGADGYGLVMRINRPHWNSSYKNMDRGGYPNPDAYWSQPPAGFDGDASEPWRVQRRNFVDRRWPISASKGNWQGMISTNRLVLTTCCVLIKGSQPMTYHPEGFIPGVGGLYPASFFDGSAKMTWYLGGYAGGFSYSELFPRWDNNFGGWPLAAGGPISPPWNE